MENLRVLLITGSALVLSACGTQKARELPMPTQEPDKRDFVQFGVFAPAVSEVAENVVLSSAADIGSGSSIVIDVPIDFRARTPIGEQETDFATRNYFNFAEQAIEKQLLLNGFVVKDRSKFEAILRDLRDLDWRSGGNMDPAITPLLEDLERKRTSGEISDVEYANQVREFRNRFQLNQQSERRSENELADTSEVIRAAGASEIRADFILQINGFETQSVRKEAINLLGNSAFRSFMDKYAAVRAAYRNNERLSFFRCDVLQASLDAKLIDVASGDVVWIGNHTVTELDQSDNAAITLEVSYRRECENCTRVRRLVNNANTDEMRIERARTGDPIIPQLSYVEIVSEPIKIEGSQCTVTERSEPDLSTTRRELASRVAQELIQTIR